MALLTEQHHELVGKAVKMIFAEEKTVGGQLGRPSGARFRTYERLKHYAAEVQGTLFDTRELAAAIDDVYRYPLRPTAGDTLNRQLRAGIGDQGGGDPTRVEWGAPSWPILNTFQGSCVEVIRGGVP